MPRLCHWAGHWLDLVARGVEGQRRVALTAGAAERIFF